MADRTAAPIGSMEKFRWCAFYWPLRLSSFHLVLLVATLVCLGEAVSTMLIAFLPPLAWPVPIAIDVATHLIILLPAYFFFFLPLKAYDAERRRAEREVSFLSRHIIRAVEEEKKRLAHDLHDECGQILTALQCGIEALKYSLPTGDPGAAQQCERLASLTAQLGDHVRSLTARLRPAMLESCGIVPTLRWHLDQVGQQWPDLKIDLQIAGCDERFLPEIEITLYRLCQEGLNNILRHARAGKVSIRLRCGNQMVELRIEDDGDGFDLEQARGCHPVPRGFGLVGMRERVADLGGDLKIRTAPGRGTVIGATLPLKGRESDADQSCHCG